MKLSCIGVPRSWSYIKNTVVLTILTFRHIQYLHLMYAAEVAWILLLVSSGTQVQPQIILNPDYLPDYLSISYDYGFTDMPLCEWLDFTQKFLKTNLKSTVDLLLLSASRSLPETTHCSCLICSLFLICCFINRA